MSNETNVPPVLILGCGRSGTSIFGELFEGLVGYQYNSEPDYADMLAGFGHSRAVKVPRECGGYPPSPGLSFPIEHLLDEHPETVVFWIVRHPFDAICSLRIGIAKRWSHHPRPPDWRLWLSRPLVEQCAHHWAYINHRGYEAVKEVATLVRFENMIENPYRFAEGVCERVKVDPSAAREHLKVWSDRVQNENNEKFIEAITSRNHSRPDHKQRIGRWRENLSNKDTQMITPIIQAANRPFGYSLEDDRHR